LDLDGCVMSNRALRTLPPDIEPARAARLAEVAAVTGARWATSQLESFRAAGRKASGGWPGTLSEARNYVSAREVNAGLSSEELLWMTRAVYDAAKQDWLSKRDSSEE
jgi:hypothetical protein